MSTVAPRTTRTSPTDPPPPHGEPSRRNRILGIIGTVVRIALAVIWLLAGITKLSDPSEFIRAVRAYDATPEWLTSAIGYGLPFLEIALAAILLVGIATRAAAAVSGLLFVVFTIGLIQAAARGIALECGCFGGGGTTTGSTNYTLDILRDLGLLALAVLLVVRPRTWLSLDAVLLRHDSQPVPNAAKKRSEAAQRKFDAVLAAHRRADRRRSAGLTAGVAVVVLAVGLIGIGVQSNRAQIQGQLTAANASVTDGITVGSADAPAKVVVYEDFQCPVCNNLEQTVGSQLTQLVANGKAQIQYHPVGYLDRASNGNQYSSRAAAAAVCASDVSVDAFAKFHAYLYSKDAGGTDIQPTEGGDGRTDAQLAGYFAAAVPGATEQQRADFESCVSGGDRASFVQTLTDNASKAGITAVPSVFVNDKQLSTPVDEVVDAINAAQA